MYDMQPHLEIDHPSSEETILLGGYVIRLSPTEALIEAEISIDRGPWQPCRHACGFWWYDWNGYEPGPHQVSARGTTLMGHPVNSTLRRFSAAPKR